MRVGSVDECSLATGLHERATGFLSEQLPIMFNAVF